MQNIQLSIYSSSYIIRKGIVAVINKIANANILSEIDNLDDFNDLIENKEPDFIIFDIDDITNLDHIKKHFDLTKCIAIVNKHNTLENDHLESISLNDTQNEILNKINRITGSNNKEIQKQNIPDVISKREVDILKCIAQGYSNKEIADILFLSAHTVVTHRKNITRKLGIKTVPGLTIYAILNKIIDINETEKS